MIDHFLLPVRCLAESRAFYIAALEPLGYHPTIETQSSCSFKGPGPKDGDPGGDFWLTRSAVPLPLHVAFAASSDEQVRLFHAAALAAGGDDNGRPGERPHYHPGYYAAFVRDPDGHNVEAVHHNLSSWPETRTESHV